MLDDRDYMRQPEAGEPGWSLPRVRNLSLTVRFLIAYAVVFLVEVAMSSAPLRFRPDNAFWYQYLALSKDGILHGYVWQLVTYQFMHGSLMHLLLNGWAIYSFGTELEQLLGRKKFFWLMISGGVVGGIFQTFAALVWPQYFDGPVVGASASAFALVAAFALIFPAREITMLILYFIPVTVRAKTLLYVMGGMALAGFSFPVTAEHILGPVSNSAHLGGMLMGIFFVRKILEGNWFQQDPEPVEVRPAAAAPRSGRRPPVIPTDALHEVDAILDKISARGIGSLTARERDVLEQARNKMRGA